MITWWMKLGGHLPPGRDALLFLTGSFVYLVTQTQLDKPRPLCTHAVMDHWGKVSVPVSFPVRGRLEPTTCQSTVEHTNHRTTETFLYNWNLFTEN